MSSAFADPLSFIVHLEPSYAALAIDDLSLTTPADKTAADRSIIFL